MNLVDRIPIGDNAPLKINCIIEVAKDTNAKYEYDEELDIFKLSRCLYSSMRYTCSYGFVPQTLALDNDPLDICVYNNVPIETGTMVEVYPIAVLDMDNNGEKDYKVIAVPVNHVRNYRSLKGLDQHWVSTTYNFFSHYKDLEDKEVVIHGWLGKREAKNIIKAAHERWIPPYMRDRCPVTGQIRR